MRLIASTEKAWAGAGMGMASSGRLALRCVTEEEDPGSPGWHRRDIEPEPGLLSELAPGLGNHFVSPEQAFRGRPASEQVCLTVV